MQADDLALLSICKQDLDNMIKTCYEYSIKWRYTLNPNNIVITVFRNSGKRPSKSEPRRTWSLGDNTISEQAWYTHVGILLYSNLRTVERTLTACRKLRGTFVSIVGVGLHPHSMNHITGRKIYERIVLPSALYGCELWSDLTRTEIKMLEMAQILFKFYTRITPSHTHCHVSIVHFKRLGSRVSHDSFNQYVFFFSKQYTYCKTKAEYTIKGILSDF